MNESDPQSTDDPAAEPEAEERKGTRRAEPPKALAQVAAVGADPAVVALDAGYHHLTARRQDRLQMSQAGLEAGQVAGQPQAVPEEEDGAEPEPAVPARPELYPGQRRSKERVRGRKKPDRASEAADAEKPAEAAAASTLSL